jgi:hypothetical protein
MNTRRFNQILAEVGGHPVPETEDDDETKVKIKVAEDAETVEAILREGVTARFDPASGNAVVTVPLAERQDEEEHRKARFNKRMRAIGGREV